jgi:hypothetical protein
LFSIWFPITAPDVFWQPSSLVSDAYSFLFFSLAKDDPRTVVILEMRVICEDRPGKLGFFDSILILIQILTSRTVS